MVLRYSDESQMIPAHSSVTKTKIKGAQTHLPQDLIPNFYLFGKGWVHSYLHLITET